ncbi:MAG: hypothetical protein IT326_00860, partial [Anaerolineae bacterium]|nr:hypothetical protein [Anaerolineae bacterium]
NLTLPSEASGTNFYGGNLSANYQAGTNDTYGWKIIVDSRPYLTQ